MTKLGVKAGNQGSSLTNPDSRSAVLFVGWKCMIVYGPTFVHPIPAPPCTISQVKTHGKPTWSRLIKAVEESNRALAKTIAGAHPGVPGNHILYSSHIDLM